MRFSYIPQNDECNMQSDENLLVRQLEANIRYAVKIAVRCPRCFKVVTNTQTIYLKDSVLYHAQCRPL